MFIFSLDKIMSFVDRYMMKRRIKKELKNKGLVLTNLQILPPGVRTPTTVNMFPADDNFDHKSKGQRCLCFPLVEPKQDDSGRIFLLVKHNDMTGRKDNGT